ADKVKTDYVQIEEGPSGVALITVDKNAENSIVVSPGANFKLEESDIDKCIDGIKESEIVVIQLETPIDTIKYALEKSKELGKFTILNPAPAVKLSDDIIKNVDLLTPNETELEILSGVKIENEDDMNDIKDELADRFSDIPKSVNALISIAYIKTLCKQVGIEKIRMLKDEVILLPLTRYRTKEKNGYKIIDELQSILEQMCINKKNN
ncbi:MAG: PfkB family carbohydrate kinase, partial [Peptostreptococcaceae bacterium]|nr:PfkB family carbohydrate kinase [Peptostreptococcaceae bacterium]